MESKGMNRLTRAIVILLIVCVTVTYIPFGVYGTGSVAYGAEEGDGGSGGDEAPPSNGYEEKILEIESTFAFSNLEFLYLIFSNDNDNEDSDFNKLLSLDAGTILEAKLYWNMASNNNVKDPFRVFPLDSPFRTTKDPNGDFILNSGSFIQNDITLSTRGLLGKNESRETEGSVESYSLDVTNDINSILNDGIIASIADDGRYGYALEIPQGMDINSFIRNGENIPKLVIRYMEETDEPPTEAELEAADKLLEARQESQSLLEGSGTVSDPYLIYDADDLQGMAENDNACYKLMNDIDLKGRDWRPPGYYYWYPFMGYLDGNGHTIKNLHVGGTSDDAWNTNAGGLFGYFEGRVENLHVETADSARKGVDFFGYAGGIAGVANAPAEIVNCSVNGYVSGNGAIGGLVGIAYPGVIIENCAAVGTVDMSDAFAYMNDNSYENASEMVDVSYDILKYMVQIFASGVEYKSYIAEGKSQSRALFDTIWSKVSNFPIDSLMNTGTMQKMRRSYIGGLVGLNYGYIGNSYASVNICNLQNYMTGVWDSLGGLSSGKAGEAAEAGVDDNNTLNFANRISRTGGLVGLTIEDYGEIKNSYYDSDKIGTESNIGVKKTTDELKSQDLFKNTTSIMHNKKGEEMWDYTVSRKSTDGLPLPKCVPVVRNNEENGYIYYNSRVLMKTRPDFIIGSEVVAFGNDQYIYNDGWYKIIDGVANTQVEDSDIISKLNEGGDDVKATGAVYCTECDRLAAEAAGYEDGSDTRKKLENKIAVTGRFQRGSDARPYHVHDIDSLLAMQDSKESHFILCNDIDFKIGSGDNTIQKYWWPAGKSHTSPIKGSLKGNVAYIGDNINKNGELQTEIYGDIMPHIVRSDRDRFTIKNLTVQSDRHVGLFACFRGTFSDINIELAGKDEWKSWRDGIKAGWKVDGKNMTAGLFTIRDKSSAGAVAGDTVNGAVIKNCIVTGGGSYTPIKKGIIKGGLRSGGIVGMNNRGCTIENCKSVVYIDACNYETIFYEDMFGTVLDIVKALISYADEIKDAIEGLLDTDFNKTKFKDRVDQLIAIAQAGKVGFMGEWGSIGQYVTDRWGNVCAGGLVGENFGKINDSKVSDTSVISAGDLLKFAGFILPHNHSMTVGRSNVTAEGTNVDVVREDQIFSYRENVTSNASSNGSVDPVADETDFAGGCGTADSPYEIKTIDQLARVRNYLKSGFHFRLENDLDFNNYRGNWVAIGTDADYFAFQGVFDGNGKTIKNLNMKSSAAAGLFGYCSGVIKNLKVENFHINTTGSSAGAIVAELCAGGRIEQCAVENSEIDSAHYSGGIAGAAYKGSLINNVYADKVSCSLSNILTPNTAEDTGLGGTSADSGFIFNNAFGDAYGIVSGMFDFVAGLPGFGNLLKGLDTGKSFVDGIFSGTSNFRTAAAGGVVGFLGGELSNSWVSRDTTLLQGMSGLAGGVLSAYEGDLVGRDFFGSIKGKNYVLATSTDRKDGIKEVGNNLKPDKFDGVIHLISGESNTDGYLRFPQKDGISLPSDIWEAKAEDSKYKFELKSFIQGRSCNPLTKEIIAKVPEIDNEDGYYMITDVNELAYVEYEGWSDYKLMNDIDLTGYRWAPLCREHDQYFDGTFDGQGYTIYGLNVETNENGGLFGYILGDVKNLNIGVEKVDAYGSAGGLAAGVFYPGNISKVSVVDNNIAIAMIGERILRNRVNVVAQGLKSFDLSKCNEKEQEAFKAFLDVIVNDNRIGLKSNYNYSEVAIMESAMRSFYENHANKITPASEDKREKLYDGKIHINGGGNADGAGVGGLAGIVGKDVIIDNCYARVNVSNANFVMAKEMDLFGYSYDLVSDILKIISEFAGHLNTMMDDDINSDNLFESYSSYRSWLEGFESLDDINDAIRKLEEGEHKGVINRAKSDSGYGEAVKVGKGEVYTDLLIRYDKYVDNKTLYEKEAASLYGGNDNNRIIVEGILKEQKNMNSAEKDGKTDYNFDDSEKAYNEALTKLEKAEKDYNNTGSSFDTEKENYNKAQSKLREAEDKRDKALKEAEKQFQSGSGKYGELMEKIEAYNAAVDAARAAKKKCDDACSKYEKTKASLSSQYNSYNVELNSFYEQADKYETSLKNEIIKTNDAIEKAKKKNNEIDTELAALEKKYEEDRNNADYVKKKAELNSEKDKNNGDLDKNNETLKKHIEQYKQMKLTKSETDLMEEYIYLDKTKRETGIELNDFDKENRKVLTEYCKLKTAQQQYAQSQEEDYIAKKSDAEDNFIKRRNAFEAVYLIFDLVKGIADLGLKLHNDFYDSCVGGLIGESRGQLINCYSIGTVTSDFSDAKSDLWGLMDTLSLDAVNSGRLVGRVRNGDSGVGTGAIYSVNKFVSNCYYYGGYKEEATEKGEKVTYVHGEGLGNPCVELTRMKNQLTFDGFDFAKIWKMGDYSEYPELISADQKYLDSSKAKNNREFYFYGEGNGTAEDPYVIRDEEQFIQIATMRKSEYYYRLDTDLDLTTSEFVNTAEGMDDSTSFFGGLGYGEYERPFGDIYRNTADPEYDSDGFAGHFDGNGHKIIFKNQIVHEGREEGHYAGGLFPVLSGSVKNLEIVCKDNGESKARFNGTLAGRILDGAEVENVSVVYDGSNNAKINGRLAAGGFAGVIEKKAYIRNCSFEVKNNLNLQTEKNNKGILTAALKGTMEYVVYIPPATENALSDIEMVDEYNNTHCVQEVEQYMPTAEDAVFSEMDMPGFDFNKTWAVDQKTNKPALRCLNSTDSFTLEEYRQIIDEKSYEVNKKYILEYSEIAGSPFEYIKNLSGDEKNNAIDSEIEKLSANAEASIEGEGTSSDPFLISNAKDFDVINEVLMDGHTFSGTYLKQTGLIVVLKPFYRRTCFSGNYNGNGYTLSLNIINTRAKDDINADNQITADDQAWGGPLFYNLNGAVFRNLRVIVEQPGNFDRGFAQNANNTLILNCLFKSNAGSIGMFKLGQGLSAVNCIFENSYMIDTEGYEDWMDSIKQDLIDIATRSVDSASIKDEEAVLALLISFIEEDLDSAYPTPSAFVKGVNDNFACFNCDIVGLEDVGKAAFVNSYESMSNKDENAENEFNKAKENIMKLKDMPKELYPHVIPWKDNTIDDKFSTSEENIVKFDLGDGIVVESVEKLVYTGNDKNQLDSVYQVDCLSDNTGAITGFNEVEAGTKFKINISYEGDNKDTDYVLITGLDSSGTTDICNLITAGTENEGMIGTLPADTEYFEYIVGATTDQTIHLYKQGAPYKAEIKDELCVGDDIDKVRFYYTNQIYQDVKASVLSIDGFDKYDSGHQNVCIRFMPNHGFNSENEFNIDVKLIPKATWVNAETMEIFTNPTKYYYSLDKNGGLTEDIDLSGLKITLNKGKPDEITRPIEELFALDNATGKKIQYVIVDKDGSENKSIESDIILKQIPSEQMIPGYVDITIVVCGKELSFEIKIK